MWLFAFWEMKSIWNSNADLILRCILFLWATCEWLIVFQSFKFGNFYHYFLLEWSGDNLVNLLIEWFCCEIAVNCELWVVDLLWIVICKNEGCATLWIYWGCDFVKKKKKSFCQIGLICFIFKKEKTYFEKKKFQNQCFFLSILKAYL